MIVQRVEHVIGFDGTPWFLGYGYEDDKFIELRRSLKGDMPSSAKMAPMIAHHANLWRDKVASGLLTLIGPTGEVDPGAQTNRLVVNYWARGAMERPARVENWAPQSFLHIPPLGGVDVQVVTDALGDGLAGYTFAAPPIIVENREPRVVLENKLQWAMITASHMLESKQDMPSKPSGPDDSHIRAVVRCTWCGVCFESRLEPLEMERELARGLRDVLVADKALGRELRSHIQSQLHQRNALNTSAHLMCSTMGVLGTGRGARNWGSRCARSATNVVYQNHVVAMGARGALALPVKELIRVQVGETRGLLVILVEKLLQEKLKFRIEKEAGLIRVMASDIVRFEPCLVYWTETEIHRRYGSGMTRIVTVDGLEDTVADYYANIVGRAPGETCANPERYVYEVAQARATGEEPPEYVHDRDEVYGGPNTWPEQKYLDRIMKYPPSTEERAWYLLMRGVPRPGSALHMRTKDYGDPYWCKQQVLDDDLDLVGWLGAYLGTEVQEDLANAVSGMSMVEIENKRRRLAGREPLSVLEATAMQEMQAKAHAMGAKSKAAAPPPPKGAAAAVPAKARRLAGHRTFCRDI